MLGIERNSDDGFLNRLYNAVDNPATESIASWSQSGKSFIIWNLVEFSRHVIPGSMQLFMESIICGCGYVSFEFVFLINRSGH